ncbi:MAG: DUF3566 domain-containing protein [Acidimicrobiales bacterium]
MAGRRGRRVVRRVDVWSVAKVSIAFYLCVLIVVLVAGTVLWNVAAAFGVIDTLDKLIRSLFALTSFQLHPLVALEYGAAIGGALCLIGLLFNVLAAVLYNLISDIVGGAQVVVVSDQDTSAARLGALPGEQPGRGSQAGPGPGAIAQPVRAQH